jgi:hypothetical protein
VFTNSIRKRIKAVIRKNGNQLQYEVITAIFFSSKNKGTLQENPLFFRK